MPDSLSELFIWDVMRERYPNQRMSVNEFDALLMEVSGSGLDTLAVKLEDSGYARIDGEYVDWTHSSASNASSNSGMSYENDLIRLELEYETNGNTTSWLIVGQIRDDNLFAPYELISIALTDGNDF